MQIKVNNKQVLELSQIQKQIIQNDIDEDEFEADMERRVAWVLEHKLEQCYARLKKEWEPKLIAAGATSLPTSPEEFAQLVFSKQEYKSRKQKKVDEKTILDGKSLGEPVGEPE